MKFFRATSALAALLLAGCASTVTIGNQTWMVDNAGTPTEGSRCYWGDEKSCGTNYRVYNWDGAQKACPEGFHLPSLKEWKELEEGRKANTKDYQYLCVGKNYSGGFCYASVFSVFWTTDELDKDNAYTWDPEFDYSQVKPAAAGKDEYLAVRCVKDTEEPHDE